MCEASISKISIGDGWGFIKYRFKIKKWKHKETKQEISTTLSTDVFKGAMSKKEAAAMVTPGNFITFYPLPENDKPIPAKIRLTIAQKIHSDEVGFVELRYSDAGWQLEGNGDAENRPSWDTLKQLLDYFSTYSYCEFNNGSEASGSSHSNISDQQAKKEDSTVFEKIDDLP
ncbi:unnamed protein product [Caenorhabditis bovis]|uniref:Uncharacterized protein n=1 Tax=Caenorhabditis bovis TaxID=2654633 RepID=A0A8S1ELI2_9PELO|nr:unnamed protein product [Caenorhabditis bovis]